ncbi:MAG: DUF2892 domain-containing protein [Bacteroidia bacterium]|nr:DUF2892 domain-containing protein [Bacteroidia bacterium]MBP9688222.1 DUF2892 domain-containing protein [Bacteroidia bacterium]
MKTNMGLTDRIVRIIVAVAIVGLFFTGVISGMVATILIVVGAIFFVTSLISFCPLYTIFGLSTCKRKVD